ncbi:hypothetical protein MATL_G00123200 [Megalops atlanticus]|uniref:Uncharacterized protein n=1 Tax=Megalops atlanticus TaxID=7932 RepID=A0A9D3Q055_MEGAT|nr:hypothetical protein MATL_G00123200 [Megalops atlanticus]
MTELTTLDNKYSDSTTEKKSSQTTAETTSQTEAMSTLPVFTSMTSSTHASSTETTAGSSSTSSQSSPTVNVSTTIIATTPPVITTAPLATTSLSTTSEVPLLTTTRTTPPAVTTAQSTTPACVGSRVVDIRLEAVPSTVISVSWSVKNPVPQMEYTVKLSYNSSTIQKVTTERKMEYTNVLPAVTYTLIIEYPFCGKRENATMNITTVAKIYESYTRIPGEEFVPEFKNQSSTEFKKFVARFINEVEENLPPEYRELINANKMRVVVKEIRKGSVIVDFDLVTSVTVDLTTSNIQANVISALNKSALGIDLNQTAVTEADACKRDPICSENAQCVTVGPTYTCHCNPNFIDKNPQVPGTDCQRSTTDPCEGSCSSLAQCIATPPSGHQCQCYKGLIDENPSNPGKICKDPVGCFSEGTDLCSSRNTCLKSKSVCSLGNVFKSTVELKSWVFAPALYDPTSDDWLYLSLNFTLTVVKSMRDLLSDDTFDLSIVGFKKGSIVVRLVCGFSGDKAEEETTLQTALQDAVHKNLDNSAVVTVEKIAGLEEGLSQGWRVATIVLGVLLGFVLLVIIVIALTFILRRRTNNSYQVQIGKRNGDLVPTGANGLYNYNYA